MYIVIKGFEIKKYFAVRSNSHSVVYEWSTDMADATVFPTEEHVKLDLKRGGVIPNTVNIVKIGFAKEQQ